MTSGTSAFGRPMRIVHVLYSTYPFDPRVRRVVETQRDWGFDVAVVALQEPGQPRIEKIGGAEVHRVPIEAVRGGKARYAFQYAVFFLAATLLVLRIRIRHGVDVVHVHSLPDFLVGAAAPAKAFGAKVILDLHEAMPEIIRARFGNSTGSILVALAHVLERVSCAFADAVLTATDSIRDLLVRRGTPISKITVVMNSPRVVAGPTRDLKALRTRLLLNGHRPIVYVGGLNKERDLGVLIRAVAGLRMDPPLRLVMFGYGSEEYRNELRKLAAEEGLEEFMLGPRLPQEEVFSYLALSEVGVVTYERNPLTELAVPNKVFEYVAAGKPVVLSRLRALESLFGDAALYYEPGKPEELRARISHLLENPQEARRLAERGSAVLAGCRWEIMEDRLRAVYAELGRSRGD